MTRAQGITTDRVHTLVEPGMSRQELYVAMSRGRQANHVYVQVEDHLDADIERAPQARTTAETVLRSVLARDGAERSATQVMRDELAEADRQDALVREHRYGPRPHAGLSDRQLAERSRAAQIKLAGVRHAVEEARTFVAEEAANVEQGNGPRVRSAHQQAQQRATQRAADLQRAQQELNARAAAEQLRERAAQIQQALTEKASELAHLGRFSGRRKAELTDAIAGLRAERISVAAELDVAAAAVNPRAKVSVVSEEQLARRAEAELRSARSGDVSSLRKATAMLDTSEETIRATQVAADELAAEEQLRNEHPELALAQSPQELAQERQSATRSRDWEPAAAKDMDRGIGR